MTDRALIDPRLAQAILDMTREEDDVSLVHTMIRELNVLLISRTYAPGVDSIVFLEARQDKMPLMDGDSSAAPWLVMNVLDPNKAQTPIEQYSGLYESLHQGTAMHQLSEVDGRECSVYPVIVMGMQGFLVIGGTTVPLSIAPLVEFFLELYRNQASLIHSKERDPLTGLYNRRAFNERIGKIIAVYQGCCQRRHDQEQKGVCLAVLDIDHFKRVNDRFGHLMGDEVLLLVSRLMDQCLRHTDLLFRFGGEEFVAILIDLTLNQAHLALERLRTCVASYPFPQVGQVTVSIGFVPLAADDMPTTLIEKADQALYYAKEHGRNQVRCYDTLLTDGKIAAPEQTSDDNIEVW
ncbi:MAG: GGDEF domain-containing protein [Magnetococcales bacterium]|nr:GGDEF domain-containing protein [Magnetococcales bacterium]